MQKVFNLLCRISTLAILLVGTREPARAVDSLSEPPGDRPRLPTNMQPGSQPTYLPLVFAADPFLKDEPIWAHSESPQPHEVALFRHTFALRERTSNTRLTIFADTHYQVWIDGLFIGSGPARFSPTLREYDVHLLGEMLPGNHNVSVLVQWAPNYRRGESTSPYLQAHIEGDVRGSYRLVTRTGPEWRSVLSTAWRSDSSPVHSWGLIGPTELLDLGQLPQDWNQPNFIDTRWAHAVTVDSAVGYNAQRIYRPRSIDLLVQREMTSTLIDAGLLSPGVYVGEVSPPFADPPDLPFSAPATTTLSIETLAITDPPTSSIRLDGQELQWQFAGGRRPDVITAEATIAPGEHLLSFADMPHTGVTFGLSAQGLQNLKIPFSQGVNAGRRLLLAEPVSDPEAVNNLPGAGLNLEMSALPAYFVLDLGRTVHGRVQAQVSGPAGSILDIGWDERLLLDTERPLPYPGTAHPQWNQVDSWIMDGKTRQISTIDARAGRYILFAVWGAGPVRLENLTIHEERYPTNQQGSFQSSDPLLNQIWQVGRDTLYPNRTDAYTDTPWRERGQWWGDAYVASQVEQDTFGDLQLLKRGMVLIADEFQHTPAPGFAPNGNGTHMLDFSMLWALSLSDYYRLSGDSDFVYQMYPALKGFMEHLESFENSETGLLDLPQGDWADTAYVESLANESRFGQSTAINSLYYQVLVKASELAELSDDTLGAKKWLEKSIIVRQRANDLLYLPADERYATTYYQDKLYPPTPQAQAWALAYGLVPDWSQDQVAESLMALLSPDPSSPNLDIYGMYWLLQALGETGHIEDALNVIRSYYGRLLSSGATTWWENFTADQNRVTSYSHAWGGSPTWFLSTYILGARRIGPDEWLVAPALRGVVSASGSIPVGDNLLKISWERSSCQNASISVQSGSQSGRSTWGEILIPFTDPLYRLRMNGTIVWESGSARTGGVTLASDGLHIPLQSGSYSFIAEYICDPVPSQP